MIDELNVRDAVSGWRAAALAAALGAFLAACGGSEDAASNETAAPEGEAESAAAAPEAPAAEAAPLEPPAPGEARVRVAGETRTLPVTVCMPPSGESMMASIMAENEDGDVLYISGTPGRYRADVTIGRGTHVTGFTEPFEGDEFIYQGALTTQGSNAQVEGAIHVICPEG